MINLYLDGLIAGLSFVLLILVAVDQFPDLRWRIRWIFLSKAERDKILNRQREAMDAVTRCAIDDKMYLKK